MTLAQRRQLESDDVEAVKQVFAETPLTHHLVEIQVGGGDDAHVGAAGHRVAHALVFLVLDEAQQLGLQGEREVTDLVEEQGAAIGLADPALGALAGAGEGALGMAEQLALHQLGGQRRAVDGHAGALGAAAPAMDGARQLALAGAGLTENEDVGIGRRHLPRSLQHAHQHRAVAVELRAFLTDFTFQRLQARRQLAHLQLLGRGHAQLFRTAGLDQVIGGAGLHGVHGGIHGGIGGDDHHAHPRRLRTHLRQHVQAAVVAQAQVEEAQVEDLTLQQRLGLGRAAGAGHFIAFIFQAVAERAQDRGLIVHQQDAPAGLC